MQPLIMSRVLGARYKWTPISGKEEVTRDEGRLFIFPSEWFNAHPFSETGACRYTITDNTHSIHHYAGQWRDDEYYGGLLHKWYYKIMGIDWRLLDRGFKLYGKK